MMRLEQLRALAFANTFAPVANADNNFCFITFNRNNYATLGA
jgi:hypothetical protein